MKKKKIYFHEKSEMVIYYRYTDPGMDFAKRSGNNNDKKITNFRGRYNILVGITTNLKLIIGSKNVVVVVVIIIITFVRSEIRFLFPF